MLSDRIHHPLGTLVGRNLRLGGRATPAAAVDAGTITGSCCLALIAKTVRLTLVHTAVVRRRMRLRYGVVRLDTFVDLVATTACSARRAATDAATIHAVAAASSAAAILPAVGC